MLNKHLSTIGIKIDHDYLNKEDERGKGAINFEISSLFLSPTVPGEVERIIHSLDVKKSNGPCNISTPILKGFNLFFSLVI